jgi:Xaa-Pro aminopeptidase
MILPRISKVRDRLAEEGIDGLLVLIEENRKYLSGFTAEDHHFDESCGALLITSDSLILATDSRFELQARNEAPDYEVVIYRNGLSRELPGLTQRLNVRKLGFESARLSVQQHAALQKAYEEENQQLTLLPVEDLVEKFRQIKTAEEIALTRQALALAEDGLSSGGRKPQTGNDRKAGRLGHGKRHA